MLHFWLTSSIALIGVDSLDGFRANLSSIEASVEFTYRVGFARSAEVCAGRVWSKGTVNLVRENKSLFVSGRWESDGNVERLVNLPSDERAREIESAREKGLNQIPGGEAEEFLLDSELVAGHKLAEAYVTVAPATLSGAQNHLITPFSWFLDRFPHDFERLQSSVPPGSQRSMLRGVHGGYATEDLILSVSTEDGDGHYVIAFDSSLQLLPRFDRRCEVWRENDTATINEMYLLDARRCKAGGFVPVEWVRLSFDIPDFKKTYPHFDPQGDLECPTTEVYCTHFRATTFQDTNPYPRLHREEGFILVASAGGTVRLPDSPTSLSMDDVRRIMGQKAFAQPPPGPTINLAEVEEFEKPRRRWTTWLTSAGLVLAGGLLLVAAYRRLRSIKVLGLLVAILIPVGCAPSAARQSPPLEARIDAAFHDENVLIDNSYPEVVLSLHIRNTGNCELLVTGVTPSCLCSLADESVFPACLKPGQGIVTNAKVEKRYNYQRLGIVWTFQTDHGEVQAISHVLMIPSARITPYQQGHPGITTGEPHVFKVLVQQVAHEADPWPEAQLLAPEGGLGIAQTDERSGPGPAQGFRFLERRYGIAVCDETLGDHKKELSVLTKDAAPLSIEGVLIVEIRRKT
jgi:hypothetical protein